MRLSLLPTYRLAPAAVIAAGAVSLLAGAGQASAVVPGGNGLIATSKCEDGVTCTARHIWTVDPTSGTQRQVTSGAYGDYSPAFSPDGSKIVFVRCPGGNSCRIAVVGAGGGSVTELTTGPNEFTPVFSPDGSKIVFSRIDAAPAAHLVVMDAGGGNEHPLTTGATGSDSDPTWSPDGSTIAFERSGRIYKIAAAGGTASPLTAGPDDESPNYSPDGGRIVFQRNGNQSGSVWTMDAGGGDQHALTSSPAGTYDGRPAYSPDGSEIAFEHAPQGDVGPVPLWLMGADGSNAHAITAASDVETSPDWQPTPQAAAGSGSPQATVDTTAPKLILGAPRKESIRKGRVYLFATSSEAATGVAGGRVAVATLAKTYRLRPATKALSANSRTRLVLKLPRKTLRAVRVALTHHQRVKATLVVQVKDRAGNAASQRLRLRLTK